MLMTPIPVLLLRIVTDALPLNPPEAGVLHQTGGLFLRVFLIVTIQAFMITAQASESSPTLPLSTARHWWIALTTGVTSFAAFTVLGVVVGFPTPFAIHCVAVPWVIVWVANLRAAWHKEFTRNVEGKRKLSHFVTVVFSGQLGMLFIYCAYLSVFTSIPSEKQVYFTILLPVIKIAFKNWVIMGAKYMEDLAPSTVAFNVDVFHAIFVSSSMQSTNSSGSVVLIMAVDVVQGIVAYYEVSKMYRLVNTLANKYNIAQSFRDLASGNARTQSLLSKLKVGVVDYALNIIESNPRLRHHPELALPQHRLDSTSTPQSSYLVVPMGTTQTLHATAAPLGPTVDKTAAAHPPRHREAPPQIVPVASFLQSEAAAQERNEIERAQLECVKGVLKMMHMIEFYVLIEFVEVIIPLISAVSTRSLVYLPNRVYYMNLASLTHDELVAQTDRVVVYALLELASFTVFCFLMGRRLHHTSTYQILAFVLQKHAQVAITALTMWAFLIVQLELRHLGVDYTFQFAWLRAAKPTP